MHDDSDKTVLGHKLKAGGGIKDGEAVIAVAVQGCSSCGQKKSCGVGKLAAGGKISLIRLPAEPGLQAGDPVTLSVDQGDINRAALLGYLLPAVLMVVGAVAGESISGRDAGAALGAFAGLLVGVLLSRIMPHLFRHANAPLSIDSTP